MHVNHEERPPTLIALSEDVKPAEFILGQEVCSIGRASQCNILVLNQAVVSRLHAQVTREGLHYLLVDVGSRNGTFVNGRKLHEPYILQAEDQIGLGISTPLLRFNDPNATDLVTAFHFDDRAMLFFWGSNKLELSKNEFRLLYHLYLNADSVCSRQSCAEAIWDRWTPEDNANLDRVIHDIRRKLRKLGLDANQIIENRFGIGYKLNL
ncbi:MAG: FHA domain-containing protein [Anaerolineae bacterium]|nr:FHA domain-containing protein [Anaerolineae bacterium]